MSQKALFTKRPLRRRVRKGVSHDTTRRSLEWLKKNGYNAATVERMRFHPSGASVEGRPTFFLLGRTDLLGFCDVLAYRGDHSEVLAVQACRRDEIQAHLRRYRADDETLAAIRAWIAQPGRVLMIHAWECVERRCSTKAGTKRRWELLERRVTVDDFRAV